MLEAVEPYGPCKSMLINTIPYHGTKRESRRAVHYWSERMVRSCLRGVGLEQFHARTPKASARLLIQ